MKRKAFILAFILLSASASAQFAKRNSYPFASGKKPLLASWINLDSDSLLEAVTVLRNGAYWSVYAAKGLSSSAITNVILADSIPATGPPAIVDFNADNQIDFIFPLSGSPNSQLLLNRGNLSFKKIDTALSTAGYHQLQMADLDNDGRKEIIVIKDSGGWSVLKSGSKGYYVALDSSYLVTDLSISDFDRNGFNDIALSGKDASGNPYLKVIELASGLKLLRMVTLSNAIDGNIAVGDLNADGYFDLLVAGKNQTGALTTNFFLNNDTVFIMTKRNRGFLQPEMLIADFDSDGKADIAFRGLDDLGTSYHWIKTASGDSINLPVGDIKQRAFGDFDRDGDLDLLLATDTLAAVLMENTPV